jgi:environmental stress-induced protein Ves
MNRTSVIRAADQRAMPWKNGGGVTTELLALPAGASLETFALRISRAHVASAGAFSSFPGVDRTLLVLSTGALDLRFEGRGALRLDGASPPLVFPGDEPTFGAPSPGTDGVDDFNVMTRRGVGRAWVQRMDLSGRACELSPRGSALVVVVESGAVQFESSALTQFDAIFSTQALRLSAERETCSRLIVVDWFGPVD